MRVAVRLTATLLALALVAACAGESVMSEPPDSSEGESAGTTTTSTTGASVEPTTFAFHVDSTLDAGGGDEAVASGGSISRFVGGTIVVTYDDPTELQGILDRYDGTVVSGYSMSDFGLEGPSVAVVEVDVRLGDPDGLAASMTLLGSTGEVAFGSEEAVALAAIAALERAAGLRVGLDWVMEMTEVPWSTAEHPERSLYPGWFSDAYELSYYRRDSIQAIGVAEAWSLMYYAGALENRVPLAVIDHGFHVDEELLGAVTFAVYPGLTAFGDPVDDRYHGYLTSTIAMAAPDNDYGIAGVAGVVADPILVQPGALRLSEYGLDILRTQALGARIINMSFISAILTPMTPLAEALDALTESVAASGVLMFSSAGNGGGHLDDAVADRPGLYGTRPCQSPGVICVGGVDWESNARHPDSVHSDPGGSVDLYAPYCVFAYPYREGARAVELVCGTSMSSPFAAGVAALVWASDPTLTAGEVWDIMESTLHGGDWPRINALDAVAAALGAFTNVVFVEPAPGSGHDLGSSVTLAAMVAVPSDPTVDSIEVLVRFASDLDGVLSEETWTVPMDHDEPVTLQRVSTVVGDLSDGTHDLTVTAEWGGAVSRDERTISVGNSAPSDLVIEQPNDGQEFCFGETIRFRGNAFDINEQLGLPDSAFLWRSDVDGRFGTGRTRATSSLSAGTHTITMRVTDALGARSTETVSVTVLPASDPDCVDLPPSVRITEPLDLEGFYVDDPEAETGVDERGAWVLVTIRTTVSDDHDPVSAIHPLITVIPGEQYSVVGQGLVVEARLHIPDGECSVTKLVTARSVDSAGNSSIDAIEISINRFC